MAAGLAAACLTPVLAPSPAAAQLPSAVKNAPNESANSAQIRSFVEEQLSQLASGDPAAVSAARDRLVDELAGGGDDFIEAYVTAYAPRVVSLLEGDDVLAKINAAVVTDRLASAARSAELSDATLALLADDNRVLALYGVEAAANVLPASAATGETRVIDAVVQTANQRFPQDTMVTRQAYDTLALGTFRRGRPRISGREYRQAVPPSFGGLLDVFDQRVGLYSGGLPEAVVLEEDVVRTLSDVKIWRQLDTETQQRAMGSMGRLLTLLAQQRANPDNSSRGARLNDMIEVVGKAMAATDPQLRDAGQQFDRDLNRATPADGVQAVVNQLLTTVGAAYPGLDFGGGNGGGEPGDTPADPSAGNG